MYEKVFEQTERFFKPVGEIWALQAQAAETLARKQTSIITDVWNQGVLALQSIPAQKNFEDVWKLQQDYWENLNGSMREMIEDTQGILLDTNQKITEVLQKVAPEAGALVKGVAENIASSATSVAKKASPIAKKAAAVATAVPAKAAKAAPPVKPIAEAIKSVSAGKEPSGDKKALQAPATAAASLSGGKSDQAAKFADNKASTDDKTGTPL